MAKTGTAIAAVPFRMRSLFGQDPFGELAELQRGFNKAFADAFGQPGAESVGAWAPKVDIFEDENGYILKLELPEVKREDVKVNLDKNVLTITGERKLENEERKENYHRIERTYGQFFRSFTLSPDANVEAISAEFKDGVLKLSIPKKEETKPKQIQVEIK